VGVVCVALAWHAERRPAVNASAKAAAVQRPDAQTRDLYLRGRYLWSLRSESSLTQAVDLFTQAIVRDPNYAPAYAGLADSYLLLRQYGRMTDGEAYPRAYSASLRALKLDDSSAEGHRSYAFALDHWLWNFPAAEVQFRRAIALDPRDAESHHWYATSLLTQGRYQEAQREIDEARQLQPGSVTILANRGLILGLTDREAGLRALLEIERANPSFASAHHYVSEMRFDMHENELGLEEARQNAMLLQRPGDVAVIDKARAELRRHGETAMLSALAEGYGRLADDPHDPHAATAALYFGRLRDRARTLKYLSLSCARRESNFQAVPHMQVYGFLRGDPEFEALMVRSRTPFPAPSELEGLEPEGTTT
jgi:tetratricopeptide (TPR) repeat protein